MTKKLASLDDALNAINAKGKPSIAMLRGLHDLDRVKVAKFIKAFNVLPAARRALVIETLAKLAEDDIDVNFSAVFFSTLNDADERVRAASIEGLWEDESTEQIDTLIAMLRDDPSEMVRVACVEALEKFMYKGEAEELSRSRRDQVYSALMAILLSEPHGTILFQAALVSISWASNEEVLRLIHEAYDSGNDELRITALRAMGHSGDDSFGLIVRKDLSHVLPAVRLEAALACTQLDIDEVAPDLEQLLADPNPDIVIAAIAALGSTEGEESYKILAKVVAGTDKELAALADEAMFQHQIFSGNIPLDDLFLDLPDEDVDEDKPPKR